MDEQTLQTVEAVTTSARQGANPETRVVDGQSVDLPYGKYVRQGDVYLQRLPIDQVDVSQFKLLPATHRQVAPGTTVGSRHVVLSQDVEMYDRGGDELTGPVLLAPNGLYLAHPKHADMDIRLPGAYCVTFPVDEQARELGEIRRRRD